MITASDISSAAQRLKGSIHKTPILTSRFVNKLTGADIQFKCENFQKTGSFKARGAVNSILKLSNSEAARGVATHSSGNHGQALAWAAQEHGVQAFIVMPENAPKVKVEAVKEYGAEVIFCKSTQQAREQTLEQIINETGATFVPPYNHDNTIEGQATAAVEIFDELQDVDFLLTPVGGGGLLSGSALSASYFSPQTRVLGCEPELADDAYRSFKSGKLQPARPPLTIADGLRTSLGDIPFAYIQKYVEDILLCSEDEIRAAQRMIWERMKIIVEPSSAVPLACLLREKDRFRGKRVAIILTGGNVDLGALSF